MKAKILIVLSFILSIGGGAYWLGQTQRQQFAVVDIQKIISQTAEALAHQNLTSEQVQVQILQFKENLQISLNDFAKRKNLLVLSTQSLFGEVQDHTEAFIRFYNEGPVL